MTEDLSSASLLWNKFLQGDSCAYSQIYKLTLQDLFRYGLLFTSDRDLVKDCIHDVFVKIYTNRSKLSTTDNLVGYLSVALKHTLLNALKKRTGDFSLDQVNQEGTFGEEEMTPEATYINNEQEAQTARTLHLMISSLTIRQREIIYYRYIKGMSIDEISVIMSMNHQSVSNVIQRSLERIRTLFKNGRTDFLLVLFFLLLSGN